MWLFKGHCIEILKDLTPSQRGPTAALAHSSLRIRGLTDKSLQVQKDSFCTWRVLSETSHRINALITFHHGHFTRVVCLQQALQQPLSHPLVVSSTDFHEVNKLFQPSEMVTRLVWCVGKNGCLMLFVVWLFVWCWKEWLFFRRIKEEIFDVIFLQCKCHLSLKHAKATM